MQGLKGNGWSEVAVSSGTTHENSRGTSDVLAPNVLLEPTITITSSITITTSIPVLLLLLVFLLLLSVPVSLKTSTSKDMIGGSSSLRA